LGRAVAEKSRSKENREIARADLRYVLAAIFEPPFPLFGAKIAFFMANEYPPTQAFVITKPYFFDQFDAISIIIHAKLLISAKK
jgi:hypothetical protein